MHAARLARVSLAWALLLGVPGLLAVQGAEAWRSAGRRLGFVPSEGAHGLLVESVKPDQPAGRAGLLAGDRILAAAGRPVADRIQYESVAEGFRRGRPVRLRIERAGEVLELTAVPGTRPRWSLLFMSCLTALGFLAVALLALAQGGGDPRVRLLFGFAAAVAVEIALPANIVGHPLLGTAATLAYYLLTGLQVGLQLHLASLIPERAAWLRARPWIVPLYYGSGLGLGLAGCATYLGQEVIGRRLFPWSTGDMDRLLEGVGLPVWALAVTLLLASQAFGQREPRGRQQAGLVLVATLPWLLYILASMLLERSGVPLPEGAQALETLILLGYPVAFFAAIFRHHLFDIELVVRRGLVYTALTGALMLVFYAALGAGGALSSRLAGGREPVWSVAGATLLLGMVCAPLHRSLHRVIDRRFFPERHALRQRLIALTGELPALGNLPRMAGHLVERLTSTFSCRSAALLLANPATALLSVAAATPGGVDPALRMAPDDPAVEHLRRAGRPLPAAQLASRSPAFARSFAQSGIEPDGLAIPLLSQERLTGLLIVGRKEGSRSYPAEELDLLSLLAHHAASVFENARLFECATYEGLTGLLRREAILEQLDRELERALRYGRPLTVAIADLDHFKAVNDRHGHLAGDALLRQVAQGMAGELRGTDRLGRYGGEEFLLVLPETGIAGGAAVAEKIRGRIEEMRVPMADGPPIRATVSIGLSTLGEEPGSGERMLTASDLVAAADRALYEAKHAGRNRVCGPQKAMISPALASPWYSPSPES